MCDDCIPKIDKSSFPKFKLTKEQSKSLPGRSYGNRLNAELTEEELKERQLYRRAYERIYRQWNRENGNYLKEYQAEYHRNYQKNHADQLSEYAKAYMKDNPEWLTRGTENRRLRKSLVYSEPYTTQDVLDKWGTICYLCNKEIDITNRKSFNNRSEGRDQSLSLDHVIPLAYGGPDTLDNVKPTHNVCNNKKGYKIPEELVTEELLQAKVLIDKLIGVKKVGRPLKD